MKSSGQEQEIKEKQKVKEKQDDKQKQEDKEKQGVKKKGKNKAKKKSKNVKSSLENPFAISWPNFKPKSRAAVFSSLKQTFSELLELNTPGSVSRDVNTPASTSQNLKTLSLSPEDVNNPSVISHENVNNTSVISHEENIPESIFPKASTIESLDDILSKGKEKKRISLDNKSKVNGLIVFGFNAVMRGLEQDRIVCVLVNSEAQPDFLIKMFIPVCNLKMFPVIPLKGLPEVVKQYFNIRNALVIGLTQSACKLNAPFRDLYMKCCTAVGYECRTWDAGETQIESLPTPSQINGSKTNISKAEARNPPSQINVSKTNISKAEARNPPSQINGSKTNISKVDLREVLSDFHLKRKDKTTRVFKPPKAEVENISFFTNTVTSAVKPSEEFLTIEMKGFDDNHKSDQSENVSINFSKKKKRKNKIPMTEFDYVPAKVRRVKSNTNRK